MTNNIFTARDKVRLYTVMADIRGGKKLVDCLADLGVKQCLTRGEAETQAAQIMTYVNDYESSRENFSNGNTERAMQPFFLQLGTKSPQKQMEIMDQVIFALTSVSDDALFAELSNIFKGNKAYRSHRVGCPEYTPENYEAQKAKLLNTVENMNLSPKAYDRMIAGFRRAGLFGNYTATAAAFGREGYEFKCAAAMLLSLKGGDDADLNRDVAEVCASIDVQAIGDAVHRGLMIRQMAVPVLCAVFLAAAFMITVGTLVSVIAAPTVLVAVIAGGIGVVRLAGISIDDKVDELSTLLGRIGISISGFLQKGRDAVDKGLNSLRGVVVSDRLKGEVENDVDMDPDFDLDPDLDSDLDLVY